MKVVILAGGLGTRILEESHLKPKPMIEIGNKPILWHIMKYYSSFGHNEFIICCGYKQFVIKEFFANYYLHMSDVTFDFRADNQIEFHKNFVDPWKVTLIDTGLYTMTGGRIKKIEQYINGDTFMLTYGDGLADVNIDALIDFHKKNKGVITMTAVQPTGRFGAIEIDSYSKVSSFNEKVGQDTGWINGGFMVLEPSIFSYIDGDSTMFEKEPVERVVSEGKMAAYKHDGFWQCMDTMRDKETLEKVWISGQAPWKRW